MNTLILSDTHTDYTLVSGTTPDTRIKLAKLRHKAAIDSILIASNEHLIDRTIHAGDLFHGSRCKSPEQIAMVQDVVEYCDYILCGNHDRRMDLSKSCYDVIVPAEKQIKAATEIDEFYLVPYGWNDSKFHEGLFAETQCDYLLTHTNINLGERLLNGQVCNLTQEDIETLKSMYSLVIHGHIHTPSISDTLVSVGTPFPLSFADVRSGDKWGVTVIVDGKPEFIESVNRREIYVKVSYEELGTLDNIPVFTEIYDTPIGKLPNAYNEAYEKGALVVDASLENSVSNQDTKFNVPEHESSKDSLATALSLLPKHLRRVVEEYL